MALATGSSYSIEEVAAAAAGPLWFQRYHRDREATEMLVHRAKEAGYAAICLTVDSPVPSTRERDTRNAYSRPGFPEMANFVGEQARLRPASHQ